MIMTMMMMITTTMIQEYGDRPPHLIHHDEKEGQSPKKKEPHIKKPLNAFMLYMKVRMATLMIKSSLVTVALIIMIMMMLRRCGQWCRQSAH